MNYENYFKKICSILFLITKVLLKFLIQNDDDLLTESGFLKSDFNRLYKEYKTFLMEQNEEYLNYIKVEEESIIEKILNK